MKANFLRRAAITLPVLLSLLTACTRPPLKHSEEPRAEVLSAPITIATWNLQIFGKTKAGKPEVLATIAKIISQYDIIALQEIKDNTGEAFSILMSTLNTPVAKYGFVISPRLGKSSSKEQYAFIFRKDKIGILDKGGVYDGAQKDTFERPPFYAHFKVTEKKFDFVLINSHTKPDHATEEIKALNVVVDHARAKYPKERDYIVLGDLNADCNYFSVTDLAVPLRSSSYVWLIKDGMDTNVADSNCTYDRIIITQEAVEDYAGSVEVYRQRVTAGVSAAIAKNISDHFPVSAKFYTDRDTDD